MSIPRRFLRFSYIFSANGTKISFHLTAQIFHLFPSIAVSLHSQIAQRCIGFKSKLPRLLRAVFHQPVIQLVQFLSDALKKIRSAFPPPFCGQPDQRWSDTESATERFRVSPSQSIFAPASSFFILCHQRVLLLHQRDHLVGHCFHSHSIFLNATGPIFCSNSARYGDSNSNFW